MYSMSLCGFSTCENVLDLIKWSVANMQVFPLKYLINFSSIFHALSIHQILFHTDPLRRSNANTVNGNLGIILHAGYEMWKAGHSDWFSNNWEIWDKSRNICVLITRVVGGITSRQPICALVVRKAIKQFFKKRFWTLVLSLCQGRV